MGTATDTTPLETKPADDQVDPTVAYIARHLRKGTTVDKIHKALQHNSWQDLTFEEAVEAAEALNVRLAIEDKAKQEAAEAQKILDAEKEAEKKTEKTTTKKAKKSDKAGRKITIEVDESNDDKGKKHEKDITAAFAQDEAVLLHARPKPKPKPKVEEAEEVDKISEAPEDLKLDVEELDQLSQELAKKPEPSEPEPTKQPEEPKKPEKPAENQELDAAENSVAQALAGNDAPVDEKKLLDELMGGPPIPNAPQPPPIQPYSQAPWQQTPGVPMQAYPYGYPAYPVPGVPAQAPAAMQMPVPPPTMPLQPGQPGPYNGYTYMYPPDSHAYGPPPNPYAGAPNQPMMMPQVPQGWGGMPGYPGQQPAAAMPGRLPASVSILPPRPGGPYRLGQALKDSYQAVANNMVNYALVVLISYVLAGTLFFLTLAIAHKFSLELGYLLNTPGELIISIFGCLAVYSLWYIVASTLVITTTSLALFDGTQKRKRTINEILSKAFVTASRVGMASTMAGAIIFLPAVLIVAVPLVIMVGARALPLLQHSLPILYVIALAWVIMASMRYALAPHIALFGRDTRTSRTLAKSHEMLALNGQWLVAQMIASLAVIALMLSLVSGQGWQRAVSADNPAVTAVFATLFLVVNAVLTMIYRDQKSVRMQR